MTTRRTFIKTTAKLGLIPLLPVSMLSRGDDAKKIPTDDPVATSMSWYYAHALAQKQQHTKPEQPLPTLDFSDVEFGSGCSKSMVISPVVLSGSN